MQRKQKWRNEKEAWFSSNSYNDQYHQLIVFVCILLTARFAQMLQYDLLRTDLTSEERLNADKWKHFERSSLKYLQIHSGHVYLPSIRCNSIEYNCLFNITINTSSNIDVNLVFFFTMQFYAIMKASSIAKMYEWGVQRIIYRMQKECKNQKKIFLRYGKD